MTDPRVPYTLMVTAGSNSTAGTVIVQDTTQEDANNPTKNRLSTDIDSSQKATLSLGNMLADYSNGDTLLVKIVGIRSGRAVHTLNTSKGTGKVTLSQTGADYAGASVNL